jgi:seryl-tRNA synthetase
MFGIGTSNLQAEITTLQEQLEDSNDRITTLAQENNSYKQTIASFMNVKASYEAEKEKMMKEHAAKVKVLEDKLVKTEKSVNQKVNEALTCIGVTTFPAENTILGNSKSPAELMETFNSLSGTEKTQFYQKHKAGLSQALGIS